MSAKREIGAVTGGSWTDDFLYQACPDRSDVECRRRSAMLSLFTFLGLSLYFSFLPFLIAAGKEVLLSVALITGILHGLNLIVARRTRRLDACIAFGVAVLGVFISIIVVYGGVEQTGLMWAFLFPPIPMFAMGYRRGLWVNLTFLVVVAVLLFSPGEVLLQTSYPLALKVRFLVVLFFVTTITYLFERARDRSARQLTQEIAARAATEVQLRQAKEEAERYAAAKGEFLATMSHELRAPMNGVVGAIHLILDGPLNEAQSRLARSAKKSAESLLAVVDDILDLSRIERGMLSIEQAPFDLTGLVGDAMEVFGPQAEEAGLALTCEIDKRIPPQLLGDCLRIRQILTNLLSNALKFTEAGGVHLETTAEHIDARGIQVRFSVRDTGVGVPLELQGSIFEVFTQAGPNTARKYGGSGLGLAICQQLVDLMGGQIGIQSDGETGSTFHFSVLFPFAAVERDLS